MTPNNTQVTVRLNAEHHTMAAQLKTALATPLLPAVSTADVLRAAVRALHGSLVAAPSIASSK